MLDPGLKEKVVLVTGANNPYGVGAGAAQAFAAQGTRVFLHYFRQSHRPIADVQSEGSNSPGVSFYYSQQIKSVDEVLERVRKLGVRACAWEADLSDPAVVPMLFDRAEAELGPVEVLVNNADSSEAFRIWGGWQPDPPPMIGDPRLLEIARAMKPLIVVDSFIRFHGADENSATEMGRVMAEVRALANAGAVVVLQHHKPKAEGTQYRGSSDIKAGVDVAFAITHEKEQKVLTVQCFKNRFGEEIAITIKPKLDDGGGFEVTRDPALQREHDAEGVVLRIVQGQTGISQSQIVRLARLPVHKTRSILKRGEGKLWRTEHGPRGRLAYHPLSSDSSFSAFQPYSPEKLKSSSAELGVIEGEL